MNDRRHILTLAVDERLCGRTVRSLMRTELRCSDARISRLKRVPDGILLNGKKVYTNVRAACGDELTVVADDLAPAAPVRPVSLPLDVRFEDAYLLVLNKPAGLTVHADSRRPDEVTLENAMAAYLPAGVTAHPVSRLDRGTSGLMTYAKSGYVHELLRRALHSDAFFREYRAVVLGAPQPPDGVVSLPIGFAEGSRYQRAVQPCGAPARTAYETLQTDGARSLLRLVPQTGRTHQLRVHMAAIGCPLAGDWLYGTRDDALIARPALHSCLLRLTHPITGAQMELACPPPDDMAALIARIGTQTERANAARGE